MQPGAFCVARSTNAIERRAKKLEVTRSTNATHSRAKKLMELKSKRGPIYIFFLAIIGEGVVYIYEILF